jgi:hypothetical protein
VTVLGVLGLLRAPALTQIIGSGSVLAILAVPVLLGGLSTLVVYGPIALAARARHVWR